MKKINKNQLVKLLKSRPWFVQVFNGLPIYLHTMATNSGWLLKKDFGSNYSQFFLLMRKSRASFYYDERDLTNIGAGYYRKVINIQKLRGLEFKYRRTNQKIRQKNIVPKNLRALPLPALAALAKNLLRELTLSVGIAHAHEGIAFISEVKLKQILDKRGANTQENMQLLTSPSGISFLSEAQKLLWQIRRSKGGAQKLLTQKFLKKFSLSYGSYVSGLKLTKPDVLKKAKQQKHAPTLADPAKTLRAKRALIRRLNLNSKEKFAVETVAIVGKWQDDRKNNILQSIGKVEPVLAEISRRVHIPLEKFKCICPGELSYQNLTDKTFLRKLNRRWPRVAYYAQKNTMDVFTGRDAAFIERRLKFTGGNQAAEIKGLVANKGLVKGKVRLCLTIDDIAKVKKGEILVASMTRPEFLPAMQKAAAFVTDEGGITSHASIISREMNKPCVIGTKIATEIFKDGDMVEVDANHGVVKKLP